MKTKFSAAANPSALPIRDRMPFILRADQTDRWLNNSDSQLSTINSQLDFCPVSRAVNNVRNESPDLVRPVPVGKELF